MAEPESRETFQMRKALEEAQRALEESISVQGSLRTVIARLQDGLAID